MFITRANGRRRRLFTRRPSRWTVLVIRGAVGIGAVCLIAKATSDRDPLEVVGSGCVAVAAAALAGGVLFRILAGRT
jgi:hypothetical protein